MASVKVSALTAGTPAAADLVPYSKADGSATERASVSGLVNAGASELGGVAWDVNVVAVSGASLTLDTSAFGTHDVTLSANCTLTFGSPAAAGFETEFKLILRGAFTPTFPASVVWADGSAPTYASPSVYVFWTVDGGTTWFGAQVGKAYA